MATTITARQFAELASDAGYNVRSYSGRFMYGADCVAIEIERDGSEAGVVADMMLALMEQADNLDSAVELGYTLSRIFQNARSDSMGLGSVLYFPSVKVEPGDLDGYEHSYDEDEDDED